MDEIAHLNLYYTQSAATFEYDGMVMQDLAMQLSRALTHIDVLEAAVMMRPWADEISAGVGMSNNAVVSTEHSGNFGDCDGYQAGRAEMIPDMVCSVGNSDSQNVCREIP